MLPTTTTQEEVYHIAVEPVVDDVLNGYNGTIMACTYEDAMMHTQDGEYTLAATTQMARRVQARRTRCRPSAQTTLA